MIRAIATETGQELLNAVLVDRQDLHEELAVFTIRPDLGSVPPFEAGQFCMVGLPLAEHEQPLSRTGRRSRGPKLLRRAYSIASSPNQDGTIELFIVLVPDGQLTPRLWQLKPGDRLYLDPRVAGDFTLRGVPEGKDLVLVGTGTGLAPYLSMLRTYAGTDRWRRLALIHGVRYARDLGYPEHIAEIAREDPSIRYLPACTREPEDSDWTGLRGRVQKFLCDPDHFEALAGFPLDPEQCHLFLCGNPAMTESVQEYLTDRGFTRHTRREPGNMHVEHYW
ncbi:MAG: ferredoxin--NADP reductase [Phycisphaeraceae bacterium]